MRFKQKRFGNKFVFRAFGWSRVHSRSSRIKTKINTHLSRNLKQPLSLLICLTIQPRLTQYSIQPRSEPEAFSAPIKKEGLPIPRGTLSPPTSYSYNRKSHGMTSNTKQICLPLLLPETIRITDHCHFLKIYFFY